VHIIREELLCRTTFVRTIILQNQHFNKIYPGNRRKYELSGNLRIYVIFGLQLQALHLSYTGVLYVILRGIARGTTFARNIFPKFIILMRKRQKQVLEHIYPRGRCLQGLLTCFTTLSCNMDCYEQLSQVSHR